MMRHVGAKGFTLVELLTVIAIVAVLTAIIMPVMLSARASARQTTCLSNIRQIGQAQLLYFADNGQYATSMDPSTVIWTMQLKPYGYIAGLHCPSFSDGQKALYSHPGYAVNRCLEKTSVVSHPASTAMLTEVTQMTSTFLGQRGGLSTISIEAPDSLWFNWKTNTLSNLEAIKPFGSERHRSGSNYCFIDGHSSWYRPSAFYVPPLPNPCAESSSAPAPSSSAPSFALIRR